MIYLATNSSALVTFDVSEEPHSSNCLCFITVSSYCTVAGQDRQESIENIEALNIAAMCLAILIHKVIKHYSACRLFVKRG